MLPGNGDWSQDLSESAFISGLILLDTRTFDIHPVQSPQATLFCPRWSPDGSLLASCATLWQGGNLTGGLLLSDPTADMSKFYALDESVDMSLWLAWSHDASRLLIRADACHGTDAFRELYLFDVASHSARRIYSTQAPWSLVGGGFDESEDAPVFISCEMGVPSPAGIESAVLYRCEVETKTAFEVARITAPQGWMIGAPQLWPDGRGMAVVVDELVEDSSLPHESAILWAHSGRNGSIPLPVRPFGTTGMVTWSNDMRCIALTYRDGEGSRIAVYRLPI